jgi:hypothetical protein
MAWTNEEYIWDVSELSRLEIPAYYDIDGLPIIDTRGFHANPDHRYTHIQGSITYCDFRQVIRDGGWSEDPQRSSLTYFDGEEMILSKTMYKKNIDILPDHLFDMEK